MCRISEKLQKSIFINGACRGLFFLNVSVEPCTCCLLVAGIETQELICNSKFALMVSLQTARRQGDGWFNGIIGIKYIANFNDFK